MTREEFDAIPLHKAKYCHGLDVRRFAETFGFEAEWDNHCWVVTCHGKPVGECVTIGEVKALIWKTMNNEDKLTMGTRTN